MKRRTALRMLCLATLGSARLAAADPAATEFFEKNIRPVLVGHCYECHGGDPAKIKGGLNLTFRDGLLKGGEHGAVLVPGDAESSRLMTALHYEEADFQMPPSGPLAKDVIANFATWIAQGAVDPRDTPPSSQELQENMSWDSVRDRRMAWWSFQPITHPAPPAVNDGAWSANPIDAFIKQRLDEAGVPVAEIADSQTLVRRLYFVLTGLPPAPEAVERFVAEAAANRQAAVEATVEELLASPAYGERWGRHWMDWVRYTETHGSEGDPAIPHAWRYRDYIIRALNADVPYDDLVREHIAGDRVTTPRINEELGINESIIGNAQFRFVQHGFSPTDPLDERVHVTDNQVDVVSKAFLGLTVSCARCHDHKFDPISQKDFYALYGIFASTRPATVTIDTPARQDVNKEALQEQKNQIRAAMAAAWIAATDQLPANLQSPEGPWSDAIANATTNLDPLHAWQRLGRAQDGALRQGWNELAAQWHGSRGALEQRRGTAYPLQWNLGQDGADWQRHGNGLAAGASPAGEFLIDASGDRIVEALLPSGTYGNLLSRKHSANLASPRFDVAQKALYVRVAGNGGARHRYVVQDYPRDGTIYPLTKLEGGDWHWQRWDMDYWKGDTAHLEISTAMDQAVLAEQKLTPSWFGISEAIAVDEGQPEPRDEMAEFVSPLFAIEGEPANAGELAERYRVSLRAAIEAWRDGRMSDEQARYLNYFLRRGLLPNTLPELQGPSALVAEYRRLESEVPVPTRAPGMLEGAPVAQPLYVRGNHKQPADIVPPRFLEGIDDTPYDPKDAGRLALAESILREDNPLTARVIVNRLWHYVFGRGIVATTDNFGKMGELPTHPELLDFLATRMRDEDWSIKAMLRLLVTSRTFQLSAVPSSEARERDPNNLLLSHAHVRRLEAEAIRDAMLATSGRLDTRVGGEPVGGWDPRRSVYVRVIRNGLDPLLSTFDFPTPFTTQGRRDSTNVPAQSLTFMNEPYIRMLADGLAGRVRQDGALADDSARAEAMFRLVTGRTPESEERERMLAYVATAQRRPDGAVLDPSLGARLNAAETRLANQEQAVSEAVAKKLAEDPRFSETPEDQRGARANPGLWQQRNEAQAQLDYLRGLAAPAQPWVELAQSLFSLKEFIYLR